MRIVQDERVELLLLPSHTPEYSFTVYNSFFKDFHQSRTCLVQLSASYAILNSKVKLKRKKKRWRLKLSSVSLVSANISLKDFSRKRYKICSIIGLN